MASLGSMVGRIYQAFSPSQLPPKKSDALKFGILGAANIAPMALITPSKSHPEVIIQAVSARDRKKAEEFAKANSIPEVRDSYEEILNDPNIDCVFIPLPNALHYEWAVRAVRAGKHVLVEKPSVSNSTEAEVLFNLPELSQPNGPVLLEAFHSRFFPAWSLFRSLIDHNQVEHVNAFSMIPWWGTSKDDIHFNYPLSGGSIMAMGTYNMAALRMALGAEPEECLSCDVHSYTDGIHDKCDYDFHAKFRFPNGAIGEASTTLKGPTYWTPSYLTVTQKEVVVPDSTLPASQTKLLKRKLTLHGFVHGIFWHRIDIHDEHHIRDNGSGKVVRRWETTENRKAYTFKEAGGEFADLPGEPFWMSYRHQLEQFVNKVKGRETQHWISGEDSIAQMKMIDMAYEKSGLGPRPTSSFHGK
ncbi:NAD(P)-binding protein [Aspergillus campestris IBT 28561]|uniref:D-xylose 1-dehydrogenase (NADP(+), D-xylono-1,5-lactone-forming) n=1 Tax=Aspergillus campestris (strain IBT 28561) TaxID=1392248 RepID=A0A2I1D2K7_ASPC2|nr:NAD(P)-binding protein [Aspergillus campestris IBT 28561]PKY04094.1 NAD(P)-binding protein [Aspergillus campestris IBT 28561]